MRTGIILLLISNICFAQDDGKILKLLVTGQTKKINTDKLSIPQAPQVPQVPQVRCQQLLQNPQSEVTAALKFAQEVYAKDPDRARFLLFFSTYNIDEKKQEEIFYTLSFWIHSLVAPGFNIVSIPERVPYSPTLYYVYFDNYGWKRESWETVVQTEPYFRAPWIHFEDLNALKLITGSNSIVRADWFISHTSDTTKQLDRDIKDILYYILIYGKGKEPKNLKEFQNAWGVDLLDARKRGIDAAAIVRGKVVTRDDHNRQLLRVRIGTGYYWETFDVKNQDREKDYIENLFPDDNARDAGEAIVTNNVGLQVYHLEAFKDGKGERVEFGDPSVVRSIKDVHGDIRVRTARSCIACHAEGIISFKNTLRELLCQNEFKIELAARNKEIGLEIKRFYLAPIEEFVNDDKALFARSIRIINNQNPIDNSLFYNNVMINYEKNINLDQAARECGVSTEVFIARIKTSISGRLLDLINGKTIPRPIWENQIINAGTFGHAMLFVYATEKKDLNISPPKNQFENIELQNKIKRNYIPPIPRIIPQPNNYPKPNFIPNNIVGPTIPNISTLKIDNKQKIRKDGWMWCENDVSELKYHSNFRNQSSSWYKFVFKVPEDSEIVLENYRENGTDGNFWRRGTVKLELNGKTFNIKCYVLERDLIK